MKFMKAMLETTKQITIASILLYWLQHPEIPPTSSAAYCTAPLALAEGCCTFGSMSPGGVGNNTTACRSALAGDTTRQTGNNHNIP